MSISLCCMITPMRRRTMLLAPCVALAAITASATAAAATLYVAKTGANNVTCGTQAQPCLTVQYTITDRAAAGDTLSIGAGTYGELLTVSKNLTLEGPGGNATVLDGGSKGTVITVPAGITATLMGLTIQKGIVLVSQSYKANGGGIVNLGTLTLTNDIVVSNRATSYATNTAPIAGGILNEGTMKIENSSIKLNGGDGGCLTAGGILSYNGTLTIADSLVYKNSVSQQSGCTGSGSIPEVAGLYSNGAGATISTTWFYENGIANANGTMTLTQSLVNGVSGTGIANYNRLLLVNSTITGNSGDGIVNALTGSTGTMDMSNTTVAGNSGVGVVFGPPASSTMRNSILAGNKGGDCSGEFNSGDYNLVQTTTGCTYVGGGHDLFGMSPDLGSIASNGGPTMTLALESGSPAINAGNPGGCRDGNYVLLTTDQRGDPRPSPKGGRCDIGAYEYQFK